MTDIPTYGEVSAALAALDISRRPQFTVTRADLDKAAEMIRRLDAALRRPLERVDYPDGWFGPRMFDDVGDDATYRDLKAIARTHGYDLVFHAFDAWDDRYEADGDVRAALARFQPADRIGDGYTLCMAAENQDGDLVLTYLKPLAGDAS